MQDNAQRDMNNVMKGLRADYVVRAKEKAAELEAVAALCRKDELTDYERQEIKWLAHRYVGTGATYGFPFLSQSAKQLESLLDANLMVDSSELQRPLESFIAACLKLEEICPSAKERKVGG